MHLLYAITVGILYGASFYLLMRRSLVRIAMGLIMISYASNLLIFVAGGLTRGTYPIVAEGSLVPTGPMVDPLPQALILTAIVISFAVLAFALILILRSHEMTGTDDADSLRHTDK
ncbi:MAG: Na+/H+ antiporter subunit C [Candidatus Omnitrophica bacterium]|nr:Na+/H+ antiporter subunit C [Candidatus Omnitrophota bacterium]